MNAGNMLSERSSTRRLAQPGGNSTLVLGGDGVAGERGGATTSNSFACGANPNSGNVLTERRSTRVHAAPGGDSSLGSIIGNNASGHADTSNTRTTSNSFACGANPNSGNVLTERPSTQVLAAPGGKSSLGSILGGDSMTTGSTGATTSNSFACGANPNAGNVLTERPSTRVHAAPGGDSSMGNIIGGYSAEDSSKKTTTSNSFACGANPNSGNVLTERSSTRVHAAPGGESSLGNILGNGGQSNTTTSNSFACNANPNSGNVLTDRPSTQVLAAPGGKSSLGSILGGDSMTTGSTGATTSNSFACGANPNAGNVLTERPSTRVHAAPGGDSSMGNIIGGHSPAEDSTKKPTTSNSFACGANPNSGNVLTERSSTQVLAAPGGRSSIGAIFCDEVAASAIPDSASLSSNNFSSGCNPNSGNVLTERSSTRIHCAPGGKSSFTLGGDGYEARGENATVAGDTSAASKKNPNAKSGKRIALDDISNRVNLAEVDASQTKSKQSTRNPMASSIILG